MEKYIVKAKAKVWEPRSKEYIYKWVEGYLAVDAITERGVQYVIVEPVRSNKWVYNICYVDGHDEWCVKPKRHPIFDESTIGRWTGLVDKYSKKIFEGDVVKTKYGRLCVVKRFSSPCYCGWDLIPVDTYENLKLEAPDYFDLWKAMNLEVVGNIHDNPEFKGGE